MKFCPSCGSQAAGALRQIQRRSLGPHPAMACPKCHVPLDVIEFDTTPPVQIESCQSCHGLFFNPGELVALLNEGTSPLGQVHHLENLPQTTAADTGSAFFYQKCPVCAEQMNRINFAGKSGIILDRCREHGIWVDGSKLTRLSQWKRGGGKSFLLADEFPLTHHARTHPATPRPASSKSRQFAPDASGPWDPWISAPAEIMLEVVFSVIGGLFD